jgi:hypothetical protein
MLLCALLLLPPLLGALIKCEGILLCALLLLLLLWLLICCAILARFSGLPHGPQNSSATSSTCAHA